MACSTISGVTYSLCESNMGGVKAIYLANREDVASVQTGTSETIEGACIATITMASGHTFQEFLVRKNTCSMTSTLNVSDNGSSYVSTELSIVLRKMDSAKRMAMNALILGECYAIVIDANNIAWLLGFDEAVTCTAGGAETGTAKADSNQYTLTLTDESLEYPYELSASALAAATGKQG